MQDGSTKCAACGAAAAGAPVASAVAAGGGMTDNVAAALAYIWIVAIVFLVIEPYNKQRFVRFHCFQSLFFAVFWVVLWVAMHIIFGILLSVTGFFGLIAIPIYGLVGLGGFILWLFLLFQAYSNKEFKLPFIGDLAAKQAGA
ncbi:MAG TPA: hypothetical protein VNW97_14845 [Candidatus Saccharimonadales bacterium]|jgi:uncharacterized membrane protein|nr:hypothetical protein [Candidatus Saccharimonadales bacterium]